MDLLQNGRSRFTLGERPPVCYNKQVKMNLLVHPAKSDEINFVIPSYRSISPRSVYSNMSYHQAIANAQQTFTEAAEPPGLDPASAMLQGLVYSVLIGVVALCAILSVYFSFRYRRSQDGNIRGLQQARMNISMGIMLIAIALIQIFMFQSNWLRSIIGAVFLLIGLFNLFAGIRNRRIFIQHAAREQSTKK